MKRDRCVSEAEEERVVRTVVRRRPGAVFTAKRVRAETGTLTSQAVARILERLAGRGLLVVEGTKTRKLYRVTGSVGMESSVVGGEVGA